jgi:hypothetical protein
MGGINATYDNSLDPGTRDVIKGMIDAINAGMQTGSVNLNITSDISQIMGEINRSKALDAFNHTSTIRVKNDTVFVNKNFDFSTYAIGDPV